VPHTADHRGHRNSGTGNFQAELTNEQFTIEEDASKQKLALTALTLSYGVVDSVDMIVSVPYLKLGASESNGTPGTQGMGDIGLDVKWRFYDEDKLSIAIKTGVTFPTGDDVLNSVPAGTPGAPISFPVTRWSSGHFTCIWAFPFQQRV